MAKINVESGGTILSSGLLQLSGGAAMSATLTAVTDQNNTASPLKLSTTAVQVNSTLQITTNSNPYIDAEDGAGNNRFQVGRDPSSQVVNIDFASNPTGGTNMVGGIRTYTDGVNLAQVMSFRKDGNVGIGTTTPIASALNVEIPITGSSISDRINLYLSSSVTSAGLKLSASNGGSWIQSTQGANGNTTYRLGLNPFGEGVNVGTTANLNSSLGVRGSGSTSATTSLLVQNSSGNNALKIQDNFNAVFGSTYLKTLTIQPEDTSGTYGNSCSIRGGAGNGRLDFYSGGNITQLSDNIIILSGTSNSMQIGPAGISASISGNAFSINSTTQGFLPPRMTNAQRAAIATPAIGLMVYCTDAVEGLYIYKSTGWTFVI